MTADHWANIIHQRRREQAETVMCPICQAPPLNGCTPTHKAYLSVGRFHIARYTLWRDTQQ